MENLKININNQQGEFDEILKNSLPDGGDISIITKDNATVGGDPAIMVTFHVQLPDGTFAKAQTVTTMKLFLTTVNVLNAKYGHLLT